jgi:hypothetical protein
VTAHPSSMVMTRIGGKEYPLRSMPTCRTCQNPNRMFIENELLRGMSYASIARALEGMQTGHLPHPNAEAISDHINRGHLPLGASAQRRLIERRAKVIGRNIETAEDSLVDYVTVNQMIVSRGFERLQEGEIAPDLTEVIAASKFLHQIEQNAGGGIDEQAWRDAMLVYMEVAREFIPADRWQEYGAALSSNPILLAMAQAQERKALGGGEGEE